LNILLLQPNETGEVFGRVNDVIQTEFRASTYDGFMVSGVPYRRAIELDPRATAIVHGSA